MGHQPRVGAAVAKAGWRMSRALHIARALLESSGDLGLAVSLSLIGLHYLWVQVRVAR